MTRAQPLPVYDGSVASPVFRRALLTLGLLLLPVLRAVATESVWLVGRLDGTSDEFAQKVTSGRQKVVYEVGKSVPAEHWFSFQPVAGEKSQPRQILFELAEAPVAAHRLTVSLLVERAGVPALRVEVNGRRGLFYIHPRLDNRMGDSTGGNRTGYSQANLVVDLPASFFRRGANVIAFEPVAARGEAVPDAGLNYDGIELVRLPAGTEPAATVDVKPTVFYQEKAGRLVELVEVFVRTTRPAAGGRLELELAGHRETRPLKGEQDFGDELLEFMVPEFGGEAAARTRLMLGGQALDATQKVTAQKKWTVFVVPHIHLDVGYTDYQAKVGVLQARVMEQAMDLVARNPDYRFSTDGSWNLENFMNTRSEAERVRMVESLRRRELFVPAQYCCLLTGFPTAETLIRSLYASANFSRTHGTPFDYANLTDVPSHTWSYPSILASAGIKYFFAGSNSDRGPIVLAGRLNEASPYWWEGPDGKKVLMWYSRVYRQVQMLFGLPPIVDAGREMLPVFLQMYETPAYHSSAVILYGTQGENRELFPQQAELIEKWGRRFAYPRLQYSGFRDAVERIAGEFGDRIQTISGDGGPYWEDGIAANPFSAAMQRNTERRAPSAEKLSTISTLVNPRLQVHKQPLDRMWSSMVLYDEHTQVVSNRMPDHDTLKTTAQLEVKDLYASTANEIVKEVVHSSTAQLADSMAGVGRDSLVVFNTLNWPRTGLLTTDIGPGDDIVDAATGEPRPIEVVSRGTNFRRVNFEAENVPATGYKVYQMRPSRRGAAVAEETTLTLEDLADRERGGTIRKAQTAVAAVTTTTLESPHYRLELDVASGAVRSLFDKELGKELVDRQSPYRFGQYVYVTGGDEKPNGILQYAKAPPKLETHVSEGGRLLSVTRTPYGWSAKLTSTAICTPRINTEIRLYEREKKVEFINDVRKNQVYRREGVYFAFPFAMSAPQFQYEIQNGVIDPTKNMLPGAGREWFSVQNWVAVQQDGVSGAVLPLDAPLLTLGDINRGEWPMEFGRRPGTIFSFVVNNYHQPRSVVDFGAELRNDDLRFRYVVTSGPKTDPVALSRMGWAEMTPLEHSVVQPQDKSWMRPQPLSGQTGTFLETDDSSLVVTAWKTAEDGDGTILRFLDLGGAARTVAVKVPLLRLSGVQLTDAVERDLSPLVREGEHGFSFPIKPREIVTVRLRGAPVHPPRDPRDSRDEGGLSAPFGAVPAVATSVVAGKHR